jgi:DNA gyrase/topoisomerase IV subunit A
MERVLQETARKSDLMSKELLLLKEEYDKERRKSLAYEQNEAKLNHKMKELGEKYATVATRL